MYDSRRLFYANSGGTRFNEIAGRCLFCLGWETPGTFHLLLCKGLIFLGRTELFFVCNQNYGKYTTSCLYYMLLRCSSLVEPSFLSKHSSIQHYLSIAILPKFIPICFYHNLKISRTYFKESHAWLKVHPWENLLKSWFYFSGRGKVRFNLLQEKNSICFSLPNLTKLSP